MDGTFLQRAVLGGLWDEVIYIETDPRTARARAAERDSALFGSAAAAEEMYRMRYHAACALYAADVDPVRRAGIVIHTDDLDHPVLRRNRPAGHLKRELFLVQLAAAMAGV